MTHLLIVSPTGTVGGAERSMLELVAALPASFRVTMIAPTAGALAAAAQSLGIHVRVVPFPNAVANLGERGKPRAAARALLATPFLAAYVLRIRAAIRALSPDIVVTNGIKAHILGSLAGGSAPIVWYLREGMEGRALSLWFLRRLAQRCAGVIAISNYVAGSMSGGELDSIRRWIVYNPVDMRRFRPGAPPAADLNKPAGEVWFGIIGALTPLKGQDLFLRAAAIVSERIPAARFIVAGANTYTTESASGFPRELERLVDELKIRERVQFLGHRSDPEAVMASLDVLVQSNRGPEGLGRSVLEAMCSGKPVIAVDRWGPAEVVSHGITGLLVPHMDVGALADAMTSLAKDVEQRERFGTAGRAWAEHHLDRDTAARAFTSALAQSMDSPP